MRVADWQAGEGALAISDALDWSRVQRGECVPPGPPSSNARKVVVPTAPIRSNRLRPSPGRVRTTGRTAIRRADARLIGAHCNPLGPQDAQPDCERISK
jgi:hypothetical protein